MICLFTFCLFLLFMKLTYANRKYSTKKYCISILYKNMSVLISKLGIIMVPTSYGSQEDSVS